MPTYEYHCGHCEATYDLQEGFSAETRHRCKECKRGMAKRVLHVPQIVFKGSGFYATDNKSKTAARGEPATEGGSGTNAPEAGASADKADKADKPGKDGKQDAPGKARPAAKKSGGSTEVPTQAAG